MEPLPRLLRLLLIEDSQDDANVILRELASATYEVVAQRVETLSALTAALEQQPWDLVIAELADSAGRQ